MSAAVAMHVAAARSGRGGPKSLGRFRRAKDKRPERYYTIRYVYRAKRDSFSLLFFFFLSLILSKLKRIQSRCSFFLRRREHNEVGGERVVVRECEAQRRAVVLKPEENM